MIAEASFTGFFKTILILIGAIVLLRFLGQLMIAKRNMEKEREMLERERTFQKEKKEKLRNFGKVSIIRDAKPKGPVEDVDYVEES